ncbi:21 kDa protein-like [Typha latifolia]|uniref:21 kDa protein-like n=1 Tax=Typha latifolia TaxID=4733 RepID=UPI003C2DA2AA
MEVQTTTLLVLLFFGSISCNAARVYDSKKATTNANDDFITLSCQNTTYPSTCVASLSGFSSTIRSSLLELSRAAVSVTLTAAVDTSALVNRLSTKGALTPQEAAAVEDCVAMVGNSVKELEKSLDAMGGMRRSGETVAVENVQTWVSAALTDENTCMGGFEGGDVDGVVKRVVRRHVVGLAQLTSNALALLVGLSNSSP